MTICAKCCSVTILCLLGTLAAGQETATKEKAISQMRRIADAMKQCPEEIHDQTDYGIYYWGPPLNVVWDLMDTKSARSPFQGFIEFSLQRRSEETPKAKRSQKLHEKYMDYDLYQTTYPKRGHFRYEFDLGSDTPELVKMLWFDDKTQKFDSVDIDHTCWQDAARSSNATHAQAK
jgi:hypothetical protein